MTWPLVEESLHARRHAAVAGYWNVVQQDRASNHVPDIVRAAHLGAIDTLFICPTVRVMGAFDPAAMRVRYDEQPQPDSEDLVNLAACDVLKNRGAVITTDSGDIPGGGPMAAVFRYTFPPGHAQSAVATETSRI
jgi:hypothetical protein